MVKMTGMLGGLALWMLYNTDAVTASLELKTTPSFAHSVAWMIQMRMDDLCVEDAEMDQKEDRTNFQLSTAGAVPTIFRTIVRLLVQCTQYSLILPNFVSGPWSPFCFWNCWY